MTSRQVRLLVSAVAVGYAVVAVVVLPGPAFKVPVTAYSMVSSVAHAADLAAGVGMIAAGLFVALWGARRRLGMLAILAGAAWFAPDWVGWQEGSAAVRSIAMVALPFGFAFLFHLVLAFPNAEAASPASRAGVVGFYAVATVASVGQAVFYDPFLDPHCWSNCGDNSFLLHADQNWAQTLEDIWLASALAAAALLAVLILRRLASASRTARRTLGPVLVPGLFAAAGEVAYALGRFDNRQEVPDQSPFTWIFALRVSAAIALALGLAWTALASRRTRSAIARLAADLGEAPQPGSLQAALARSLGDDGLKVAYWLPGSQSYVDADGHPVETTAGQERARTPIVRNGQRVALLVHDTALPSALDLEREIGAAARLAIDNERLRAEVLAQLEDLRSSRARIVEAGDSARRRIERDLHDGAQQRLLTLSYELRMARAAADATGDAALAAALASPCKEVGAALEELRDLAHGIYPAILTEAGLAAALATLADEAPLPVEIEARDGERYPSPVEIAVYLAVDEAVADAARRNATHTRVRVVRDRGMLNAEVTDDGVARSAGGLAAEDRIGALGGSLDVGATTLRLEVPCA